MGNARTVASNYGIPYTERKPRAPRRKYTLTPRLARALEVVREIVGPDGIYDLDDLVSRTGDTRHYLSKIGPEIRATGTPFPWRARRKLGGGKCEPAVVVGEAYEAAKEEARAWFLAMFRPGARYEAEDRDPLRGPWRASPPADAIPTRARISRRWRRIIKDRKAP